MNIEDTVKLLKECNSGTKMAVDSINQVIDRVDSKKLTELLNTNLDRHSKIGNEVHTLLSQYGESEKDPQGIAKTMSYVTTEMKLMVENSDHEIASLMIDGCNMGIKKVSEYVNKYENASSDSINLATKLIQTEQNFMDDLRLYL